MLNQKLQLKLSQKLSPQQIQLMKLIQLSTQEFEQRLSREIEENPALDTSQNETEENSDFENESTTSDDSDYDEIDVNDYLSDDDIPDYKLKANNYTNNDIWIRSGDSGYAGIFNNFTNFKCIALKIYFFGIKKFIFGQGLFKLLLNKINTIIIFC